ncbi:MAG: GNAT family N-acetyltransferase [Sandarakinorhabdus sp.]|nr:GNAT family N-acetyltransferase [Sandarakinorhabdus sp.]
MSSVDFQPTLASPAVSLRPLAPDDWPALYAVASDPLIWAVHPAHDRWQKPVFRAFFAAALASGGALVAIDPATGAIIGSSRFDTGRAGPGEVEIGWTFLARSHWGGPTNAAMKALMIAHAVQHFDRVIFLIGESNIRSRRALEKIGGTLTDREDVTILAGVAVRHVIYAIDRESFATGPLSTGVPASIQRR